MKLRLQDHEISIFDITFGQIEDLINAVKLDDLQFTDRNDLKKCLSKSLPNTIQDIRPIILSMFNMTGDEFNRVMIDALVDNLSFILYFALNELAECSSKTKSKKGGSDAPLYHILFELQLSLCEKFSSLTPFILRREKAKEVFLLIQRLNESQSSNEKHSKDEVIRRPAQDDSWF